MHRRLSFMLFALFHADEKATASVAWELVLMLERFLLVLLKRTFADVTDLAKITMKRLFNHMKASLMLLLCFEAIKATTTNLKVLIANLTLGPVLVYWRASAVLCVCFLAGKSALAEIAQHVTVWMITIFYSFYGSMDNDSPQ